jgi:uncharacterized protein YndB with AHSA1/START domain
MSDYRIVKDYPHSAAKVWRALTDPALVPLWTASGRRLEPHSGGTRLTFEHTGFSGVGGFVVSRILASVRKKMLGVGLPAVLDDIDDDGELRPGSS